MSDFQCECGSKKYVLVKKGKRKCRRCRKITEEKNTKGK